MSVAPFPWHSLPRVAASEAAAIASLRAVHPTVSAQAIAATLADLIGHSVVVEPRRRGLSASAGAARIDLGARGACTLLARPGELLAIEIEAELALAVVGALASVRGLPKIARARKVEPEVAGALASVLQYVTRAVLGDDWAIAIIEPTSAELRARLGSEEIVAFDCTVRVGALKSMARVAVTVPRSPSSVAPLSASSVLMRLGGIALSLPVVLASGWAKRREVALSIGDVVVIDSLRRDGACILPEATAREGIAGMLLESGRLRLGGARVQLAAEPSPFENGDRAMSDSHNLTAETMEVLAVREGGALADALADLPIEVRVEVGMVTMPARAWVSIGEGDVVVLDQRIGESVLLRVGGKIVGRGELVDVEGAIGVRLLERRS